MAIRTIRIIACALILVMLNMLPLHACFGPKLFFGVGDNPEQRMLYALITLYVKEKTGVECTMVEVEQGKALLLIEENKADLVLASMSTKSENTVFAVDGYPSLVSGPRPYEDLQFTTVLPAIKKLNRLLKKEDMEFLLSEATDGESAMSVVRKFFMERRWI